MMIIKKSFSVKSLVRQCYKTEQTNYLKIKVFQAKNSIAVPGTRETQDYFIKSNTTKNFHCLHTIL